MIHQWGRGKVADAINPKFLTPSAIAAPTYIKRYQYRPDVKFEFRYITPSAEIAEEEVVQHGGDSRRRKRRIYRTKDVYEALRIARLAVDEVVDLDAEAIKLREIELKRAEKAVRERLQERYGDIQGYPAPREGLSEFVSALRFSDELEVSQQDMEQIILIILIDELTDE